MDDAHHLEQGRLVVFRRDLIFYARLRLSSGKYSWKSLKTEGKAEAIARAYELFYQSIYKQSKGLPLKGLTMGDAVQRYIAYREKSHEQGKTSVAILRQVKRAGKFWVEYIGHMPVELVGDKELRKFIDWRRDYYSRLGHLPKNAKRVPVDKTL